MVTYVILVGATEGPGEAAGARTRKRDREKKTTQRATGGHLLTHTRSTYGEEM